ncbi:type II secretion system protein E [Halalkalibacillus sediminis]|uniref:Type II secretion system protein E n=1 Tax=Halalkalibacillus sediminis TaxID=2018042 RepID=A0A2I0QSD6_9BACI|nr:CpaF family protein [Halalkalibacillus sediminis]PKR77265.1 type II secretion system protein E [Halalkalibacillus sediminis]
MSLLERLQNKQGDTSVKKEDSQLKNDQKTTEEKRSEATQKVDPPTNPVEKKVPKLKTNAQPVRDEKHIALKNMIHKEILKEIKGDQDPEDLVHKVEEFAVEMIRDNEQFRTVDRKKVIDELVNDLTGFGPINPLLNDPEVTEVMVNGPNQVYCERSGKIVHTDITFRDDEHVMHVIEKIVAPIGRRIDESSPMVDARLPDGSRVNAIIPPLALNGPTITIRKFAVDPFTIDDLVSFGTLTQEMATFLDACVKARLNVFVSGGTGSGKTTTLNVLSGFIPNDERIVTIEDAAELQMGQDHVVSLESRPPNIEGTGAITIRDLVRNSLRMRPDRVIIGEVRGAEALDMLQAMNTGHDGSLATGHSNSPRDMLSRLETMVLLAGVELPIKAIRDQISGAIDVIIQQSRLKDGSRKIVKITEVQGMEGDIIVLQDIFEFEQTGIDDHGKIQGALVPTGVRPKFYEQLERANLNIPANVFVREEEW